MQSEFSKLTKPVVLLLLLGATNGLTMKAKDSTEAKDPEKIFQEHLDAVGAPDELQIPKHIDLPCDDDLNLKPE